MTAVPTKLRSLVRAYMLNKGLEEVEVPEPLSERECFLFFRDANNIIAVKILNMEHIPLTSYKSKVEEEILKIVKEMPQYADKAYLAIHPLKIAYLPPQRLFEASGIGLIEISGEEIVEKIPPRPIRYKLEAQTRRELGRLGEELRKLAERMSVIERRLLNVETRLENLDIPSTQALESRLSMEIEKLSQRIAELEAQLTKISARVEANEKRIRELYRKPLPPLKGEPGISALPDIAERGEFAEEAGLPDFIRGNPWLDVLKKTKKKSEK